MRLGHLPGRVTLGVVVHVTVLKNQDPRGFSSSDSFPTFREHRAWRDSSTDYKENTKPLSSWWQEGKCRRVVSSRTRQTWLLAFGIENRKRRDLFSSSEG